LVNRSTMNPLSWQVTHSWSPTKRGGDEHQSVVMSPSVTACSEPGRSRAVLVLCAGGL
jgi:hypothetical protein